MLLNDKKKIHFLIIYMEKTPKGLGKHNGCGEVSDSLNHETFRKCILLYELPFCDTDTLGLYFLTSCSQELSSWGHSKASSNQPCLTMPLPFQKTFIGHSYGSSFQGHREGGTDLFIFLNNRKIMDYVLFIFCCKTNYPKMQWLKTTTIITF